MTLLESKLIDLVLDLHARYGGAQPRPNGNVIQFSVVDNDTTQPKAVADLEALLAEHGVRALYLNVTPGLELKQKFNRRLKFSISASALVGRVPL